MDYLKKSIISFVCLITVVGFGQYFEIYKTGFSDLIIAMLVVSWIAFMYFIFRYIFVWYREDLKKRTETELERIEDLDEDEKETDKGWIPRLF